MDNWKGTIGERNKMTEASVIDRDFCGFTHGTGRHDNMKGHCADLGCKYDDRVRT